MQKFYSYRFQTVIFIVIFIENVSHSNSESNSTEQEERIVTDLGIIESYDGQGVPIDYSYNETRLIDLYSGNGNESSIQSDPGCPRSIDGFPWVQYGNPPACYLVGYKGPCNFGEILVLESLESRKTFCACKLMMEEDDIDALDVSDDGKYLFSKSKPHIFYSRSDKKCHFLRSPDPMCEAGHVPVRLRNTSIVKCLPDIQGSCGYNYETQTCEVIPAVGPFGDVGGGAFGTFGPILPFHCGSEEKYSTLLKRCLKGKGKGFVLG